MGPRTVFVAVRIEMNSRKNPLISNSWFVGGQGQGRVKDD